jgi:hypothetical protein
MQKKLKRFFLEKRKQNSIARRERTGLSLSSPCSSFDFYPHRVLLLCVMSRPSPLGGGPLDTATAVSAPAPAFEIDAVALASYLRSNVVSFPALEAQPLRVSKFTHGHSNPTYLLQVHAFGFWAVWFVYNRKKEVAIG